jgi:hypothetical protein
MPKLLLKENDERPIIEPVAKPPLTRAFDSARWSGDVDEQRTQAKRYVIGVAVLVVIAVPFAVWIGKALASAIGL